MNCGTCASRNGLAQFEVAVIYGDSPGASTSFSPFYGPRRWLVSSSNRRYRRTLPVIAGRERRSTGSTIRPTTCWPRISSETIPTMPNCEDRGGIARSGERERQKSTHRAPWRDLRSLLGEEGDQLPLIERFR